MNISDEAGRIIRGIVCGMKKHTFRIALASICCAAVLAAADAAWKWAGSSGDKAVSMLIIGDIDIQLRADPTTAFTHIGETLKQADLVYANLEGMLVKPQGPEIDIPDKRGWRHPGPDGVKALTAWNVKVVGVANNVAYDRANILQTLKVLDANGITHTGGGTNIAAAHKPAIVERKGVKIGFLQYTARWYQDDEQIATDTEPGVAKISSRDGVTIDPADVERVRDDIRRLRRRSTSSSSRTTTATARPRRNSRKPPRGLGPAASRRSHSPSSTRSSFAHLALDAGADLVYGHGTHTVQGVEVYKASRFSTRSATRRSISRATRSQRTASSCTQSSRERRSSRVVRAGHPRCAQRRL